MAAVLAGDARSVLASASRDGIAAVSCDGVWTNVAGEVLSARIVSLGATSVRLATGSVTQRVARSAFPASEIARMQAALGVQPVVHPPSAIAPAWNDFAAKCAADQAMRNELVALLGFIAASSLDETAKKEWTQKARECYRASYKRAKKKNLKGNEK